MKNTLITAAAALLMASAIALPAAAEQVDVFSFKFSYESSELATPEAQQALLTRLEREIRAECRPNGRLFGAAAIAGTRSCIDRTMRQAVNKMNSQPLAALLANRSRG
jgi:UrcA family protein